MYSVERGFKYVLVKIDKSRVTAACLKKDEDGCKWRVYASLCTTNKFFYIRTMNSVHTCSRMIREKKNASLGSRVVSTLVLDKVRDNPLIKPVQIMRDFKESYGLDIPYHIAWHVKEFVNCSLHGDEAASYSHLHWYTNALLSTNPGSHCVLNVCGQTSRFQRLFICFKACIEGFKWCRPMLFIDGTFIKNKYKGTLLGACAKTGNKGIFPFAFAIVDVQTEENWMWFLQNLAEILYPQGKTITLISDRNIGLINAVKVVFPNSPHGYCIVYLKQNLLKRYPTTHDLKLITSWQHQ